MKIISFSARFVKLKSERKVVLSGSQLCRCRVDDNYKLEIFIIISAE